MPNEVEFKPDERRMLDWLQEKVKTDNALTISDTALIQALGWDEKRFFVAKGHLLCAGALAMYRDGAGRQCLRLLMPERPGRASKRYVFRVVPLELNAKVTALIAAERTKPEAKSSWFPPARTAKSEPGQPAPARRDFRQAHEKGREGLGVSPVKPRPPGPRAPLRPPVKRQER